MKPSTNCKDIIKMSTNHYLMMCNVYFMKISDILQHKCPELFDYVSVRKKEDARIIRYSKKSPVVVKIKTELLCKILNIEDLTNSVEYDSSKRLDFFKQIHNALDKTSGKELKAKFIMHKL